MSVNELEKQFDTRLFDRYGKRLQLNELGRQLLPRAQALLDQGQEIETLLHGADDVGPLRLGATLTIGNYLAPLLLGEFMGGQPETSWGRIHLEVHNTATIIRQVAHFELDFGLIEGLCQHPDLEVTPWIEDELVVFAGPDHALAGKRDVTLEELLAIAWIVREPGSGTRQTLDAALGPRLPRLKVALELEHTEAIKRAVELPTPGLDLRRQFNFIIHRQKFRTRGILRFLELCRRAVEGIQRSDQIVLRRADGSVIDYR